MSHLIMKKNLRRVELDRITIVGMGLIGSSLGMALKKAGIPAEIVGTDRDRGVDHRPTPRHLYAIAVRQDPGR